MSGSSSCWRNCGSQEANHYHLFWSCPEVNSLWCEIHKELTKIFGTNITFNWNQLFVGILPSVTDNKTKYLFGILSIAARKAITKKWLKPVAPSIEDRYEVIYDIYVMERITFSLRLQKNKLNEIWEKWKGYISHKRQSFV